MDENNPHAVETKFSIKIYWKAGVACGKDGADRVELRPLRTAWPTLDFELPRQAFELDKVERLMLCAYERGIADNKVAISKLLKETIGL